jgi:hypothetical protein
MQFHDEQFPTKDETAVMMGSFAVYGILACCVLSLPPPEAHHAAGCCYAALATIHAIPLVTLFWIVIRRRKK